MSIWFTSDQHFDHANVIKYCNRPFTRHSDALAEDILLNRAEETVQAEFDAARAKDVQEMNAELIRRHNVCVKPGDRVYHLGDFSLSRAALPYLKQLNGKHTLVMGNHDHCHPAHAKSNVKQMRMVQEYHAAGFDEIMLSGKMEIGGVTVLLNHMPYSGDTHESEDRYKKYRPIDTGGWLLHGHVHQHWMKRGKQINVGVDVWAFAPVSEEELIALITGYEGY